MSSNHSSSVSSSPSHTETTRTSSPVDSSGPRNYCAPFINVFVLSFPDPLHDGLSSSHSGLGQSPSVAPGVRETESVEYSKESKRGRADRGEIHFYISFGQPPFF